MHTFTMARESAVITLRIDPPTLIFKRASEGARGKEREKDLDNVKRLLGCKNGQIQSVIESASAIQNESLSTY
jgi:hypothetical protein